MIFVIFQAQGSWASDCFPSWALFSEHSLAANFGNESTHLANTATTLFDGLRAKRPRNITPSSSILESSEDPQNLIISATTKPPSTSAFRGVTHSLTMAQLHADLQTLLLAKASLSCWISWLDKVVHRGLSGRVSGPKRANAARHLMLVWNYYRYAICILNPKLKLA